MDKRLIAEKLETPGHCVRRIREKCPANASLLADDRIDWDIVHLGCRERLDDFLGFYGCRG